ncbi:MAG: UDP-3-O-(3-hydroxymyristoyl)glucosamine N-acyltransferase [Gammaproteobacteria bacterium]|jgi:UDP-3-O-[3-hydroxymyristoyl] glucosamine N-acyltransferase
MQTYTLDQLARLLDPAHHGDSDMLIRGVSSLEEATGTSVAFAEDTKLLDKVMASAAAVVLVPKDFPDTGDRLVWRVDKPRIAFLKITELFAGKPAFTGIHERASIDASATLGAKVSVDACAVIAKGAVIGDGCRIGAGAFIGEGVVLGRDCIIEANATILPGAILGNRVVVHPAATISADGFGFVWLEDHHHKVPQIGRVEIGDDVEIGASTCIDRATLGVTRIGRGTKIDNQVHVGHNCDIGEHVLLVAQVGISGSVTIGDNSVLGGKVGVVGHLRIGSGTTVGGRSTVTKDIPDNTHYWGTPAREFRKAMREQAAAARLPDLLRQVKELQEEIEQLKRLVNLSEHE